ncbi:MAG: alkaline phosphatase family protein [Acidobacteriota bacterium]|nr:alkaline phosphatase family protein [Acidobacteriota bacterium]
MRNHTIAPRAFLLRIVLLSLALLVPVLARAQAFVGKPKLIVIVVIDQFRADYLNRHAADFKGRGFNLFMKEGAWFTDCYYDYANTKTAPGHSTIGTGAYTDGHGIESNEWWDAARGYDHQVSSVEDERYQLVDLPPASIPANQPGAPADAPRFVIGASPLNLRATTIGDELRLATQGRARVYGVSLKDRAAILPAGQAANGAFWIDQDSGQFTTSTYYMQHLPEWAAAFNHGGRIAQAEQEASVPGTTQFYELVGRTPAANRYELDFTKALITGEQLGQRGVTDLVVVSLSANDIQGHQFGPDSDSENNMILSLDQDLGTFFSWLDKNIGLNNVWLALTADHGIAPVPGEAAKLGIQAAAVDMRKVYAALNATLNQRHSPGQKLDYLLPGPDLPYIDLDKRTYAKLHIDEAAAEDELAALLPGAVSAQAPKPDTALPADHRLPVTPRLRDVYTRLQLASGPLPPSDWGRLLAHSYTDHGNWYVMAILDPYQLAGASAFAGTNHFTPWSYDRHVPLAFFGQPFIPGEYHGRVAPVDLAVTLASLAGTNLPSAAVGHVLTQAIQPTHPAGH